MVCSGALGFFLLFLLHPALGVHIKVGNLQNIIKYLQNMITPVDEDFSPARTLDQQYDGHRIYGANDQYAMGINVPVRYCQEGAALQNFLPDDNDARKVRHDMAGADQIYRGTRLIGARPKLIPGGWNNYHSEYLLLIQSQTSHQSDPLMRTLLNSDPNGCTVFFTLNSPCVKTCSTPSGPYSIIPALEMFRNHSAPKAFVFSWVWDFDVYNPNWQENIKVIHKIIPVYRCHKSGCIPCVNNNKVNESCLRNPGY